MLNPLSYGTQHLYFESQQTLAFLLITGCIIHSELHAQRPMADQLLQWIIPFHYRTLFSKQHSQLPMENCSSSCHKTGIYTADCVLNLS